MLCNGVFLYWSEFVKMKAPTILTLGTFCSSSAMSAVGQMRTVRTSSVLLTFISWSWPGHLAAGLDTQQLTERVETGE